MLVSQILNFQALNYFRKRNFKRSIFLKIIVNFNILLMLFFLSTGSYFFDNILSVYASNILPIDFVNQFIFHYYFISFLLRYFFQNIPIHIFKELLILPIKKRKLINTFLFLSQINIFNLIPFVLLLPFGINTIIHYYSISVLFFWFSSIFIGSLISNFLILYIRKFPDYKNSILYLVLFIYLSLIIFDIFNFISIKKISFIFFNNVINYFVNFFITKQMLFIDKESYNRKKNIGYCSNIPLFNNSLIFKIILLEIKLIVRNKQTRIEFVRSLMPIFILLFILIFFRHKEMVYLCIIFSLNIFFLRYGNLMLSLESNFHDFLIYKHLISKKYFISIYFLLLFFPFFIFILLLIFFLFDGIEFIPFHFASFIYSIGIVLNSVFYSIIKNPNIIDLDKVQFVTKKENSFFLNMNGLILFIIAFLYKIFPHHEIILNITLISFGLFGIILTPVWLNFISRKYIKYKYHIASVLRGE